MEAVVDVKYRPVLFPNGGAAVKKPRLQAVWGGGEPVVLYRECLKNHAASLGGYAVDGCGEFMPSPAANLSDPASLKCAACGCHRNFHRRLPEAPPSPPRLALPPPPPQPPAAGSYLLHGSQQRSGETPEDRLPAADYDDDGDSEDSGEYSDYDDNRPASPELAPPGYLPSATHMLLALSTGAPGFAQAVASRPPPLLLVPQSAPGMGPGVSPAAARKRVRTKFSPDQKQQMQALSERLGWRLQKRDEALVEECCREIGVGKGIFKVWMHNNKHNFLAGHSARRTASSGAAATATLHPCTHPATPGPPAPATTAPPVHTDFNINGSSMSATAADRHTSTASGGSPLSS